ncbi:MAG: hypothetical protein OHK006_21850 [Thermodesulfovibrionales bacterium]
MTKLIAGILLCFLLVPITVCADEYFEARLDQGLRTSEAQSYALIEKARANRTDASALLHQAEKYSPNLPAVFFEMAKANFTFSYEGVLASVNDVVKGFNAYTRNFLWALTFACNVYFGLLVSFFLCAAVIVGLRTVNDFPLLGHELRESGSRALLLTALIVLSAMSPLLLVGGMMVLLGVSMRRMDKAVVIVILVALAASPFLFRTATLLFNGFTSGQFRAVVEANESKGNLYALTALGEQHKSYERFSHALALKRTGRYDEAIAIYRSLLEQQQDPKVCVNLGNCYLALNRPEEALAMYEKAIELRPLASAYYNHSQVSRELLQFEKGDEYFKKALEIDRSAVSAYRDIAGRSPNRLVVDETLSFEELWQILRTQPVRTTLFGMSLVTDWVIACVAVLLIVGFWFLSGRRGKPAVRCKRCGLIFCPKCEKGITWGGMCAQCFRSLVKLEELEVKERVAQLLEIYESQRKRRMLLRILSFGIPGAAQVFGGKVLFGFLLMWPFLFFASLPVMNTVFGRGGGPAMHGFLTGFALVCAGAVYLCALIITRQRISKGWL